MESISKFNHTFDQAENLNISITRPKMKEYDVRNTPSWKQSIDSTCSPALVTMECS